MGVGADEPSPLPADPLLADVAVAMRDSGQAAWILDDGWRFVYVTDDARTLWADKSGGRLGSVATDHHLFSTESLRVGSNHRFGMNTVELWRETFLALGGLVLADTPGGREELRCTVDPRLRDLVDEIEPIDAAAHSALVMASGLPGQVPSQMVATRIRDDQGRLHGTVVAGKPTASMSVLGGMAWERDLDHLARMERFTKAGRHPTAILFADVEGSSMLLRTLPTAAYFTLSRRLVRVADQCVVDAGGLVGRHLGDGVVAYFPADTSGSESDAARACIVAARTLRRRLGDVAARSDLAADVLGLRFGLHWGSTAFIGKITTTARAEVTALGDEVNEAARIEACATGGRVLASKSLLERLDAEACAELGIDPDRITYTKLGDLATATAKARRDAPAIAVCEL